MPDNLSTPINKLGDRNEADKPGESYDEWNIAWFSLTFALRGYFPGSPGRKSIACNTGFLKTAR
jgi:hypothetical protein